MKSHSCGHHNKALKDDPAEPDEDESTAAAATTGIIAEQKDEEELVGDTSNSDHACRWLHCGARPRPHSALEVEHLLSLYYKLTTNF